MAWMWVYLEDGDQLRTLNVLARGDIAELLPPPEIVLTDERADGGSVRLRFQGRYELDPDRAIPL